MAKIDVNGIGIGYEVIGKRQQARDHHAGRPVSKGHTRRSPARRGTHQAGL